MNAVCFSWCNSLVPVNLFIYCSCGFLWEEEKGDSQRNGDQYSGQRKGYEVVMVLRLLRQVRILEEVRITTHL